MGTTTDTKPIKSKGRLSRLTVVVIYILAGLSGIFVTKIFFGFLSVKENPSKKANAVLVPVSPSVSGPLPASPLSKNTPTALTTVETKPILKQEEFVLSGLFCAKEGSYALINNHIVKEGDMIEKAKVKKISEEGVTLEAGGSTMFLSAKQHG